VLFGIGEGLLVRAKFGATPWTVVAQGLTHQTGISIGLTTLSCSVLALLGWIPLRQRMGLGTIANTLVFPVALDLTTRWAPDPNSPLARAALMLLGLALFGCGASLYLSCLVGPGPRDGLMTGLQRRLNSSVSRVRFGLETSLMGLGWLLGGRVGVATFAFSFGVGYIIALYLTGWKKLSDHVTQRNPRPGV
jgi:uncharacterized membrane protein YczE